MKEVKKKEIWKALTNYNKLFDCLVSYPDEKIGNLLVTIHNGDKLDIVKTKNINVVMEALHYIANIDKEYFKTIKNSDISTEEDKKLLFEKPADAKKFSWKQILRNMQEAFDENNKTKYYKIFENGNVIEFVNEEATPIPFHIKITCDALLLLIRRILHTEYYYSYNSLVIEDEEFHEICLKDRWNIYSEKDYIDLRVENKTYKEQDKEYIELLKKNKLDYEIKRYKLTKEQIDSYQEILKREKAGYIDKFFMKMFINYYSPCIMPLKGLKTFFNMEQINILFALYNHPEKTFNEFMNVYQNLFKSFIMRNEKTEEEQEQYMFYIEDPFRVVTNMKPMIYQKYYNSTIDMIEYFLSYIYKKQTITIDGKNYKKDVIIKSFKQSKWSINPNKKPVIQILDIVKKNQVYTFKEKYQLDLETLLRTIISLDSD